MNVLVSFALWLIFAHWVADFVCQTHWQASNKSKNWEALTRHVVVYTVIMAILLAPWLLDRIGIFVVITFAAHFATDAVTSRITARLYAKQNWHYFFVVIGFDQFLHYTQLFLTLQWLTRLEWL